MLRMERNVNQTLWYAIMEEPYQGDVEFENDTFLVRPYNWNDEANNDFHFWHKPSGLKVYWYKYPLRSCESNMEIINVQFYAVLEDCMNSVRDMVKVCTFDEWWKEVSK